MAQPRAAGQASQDEPPQSASVSSPFFTPSTQLAGAHDPLVHTRDAQSVATWQAWLAAHSAQASPPQSTSLSVPFFTPSPQFAPTHWPCVHTVVTQSLAR